MLPPSVCRNSCPIIPRNSKSQPVWYSRNGRLAGNKFETPMKEQIPGSLTLEDVLLNKKYTLNYYHREYR